ncbi:MAG: hypothetical protein KDI48_16605 [Xanthomonadales bacterium]|nr:hypothetical protein [Xanthomonadales bacterium]
MIKLARAKAETSQRTSEPGAREAAPAQPTRRRLFGAIGAYAAAGAAAGLGGLAPTRLQAAANAHQQGLSGAWYDVQTPGQGLLLEVYPHLLGDNLGQLFGGWFTYTGTAGGVQEQRWYTLGGEIVNGSSSIDFIIYLNEGGVFNTAPETFAVAVGSGQIRFDSCTAATLSYRFDDGREGSIELYRLLDSVGCNLAGTTADTEFAYSGSWYDSNLSGQGMIVEINPVTAMAFLAWYTYAADGSGQRWFTAQGLFAAGDRSVALTLYETTGGIFDSTPASQTRAVGSATLRFGSCSQATLQFAFNAGELSGRAGTINLSRAGATPGACVFGTSCALIPSETEGPYPLLAVLNDADIRRSDITEDRLGVPLTMIFKLVNINDSCKPVVGSAVYAWHCDKDGVYSGYGQGSGERFLRGVQVSDRSGQVVFQTIYPGWYTGRITHIHFRVYLNESTGSNGIATSQVAFPVDVTTAVYNSALYAARGQNTSVTSFSADGIFRDGVSFQLASLSGNPNVGFVATLIVGIAV